MRRFYDGVKDLDGVIVYGDFSRSERAAVVALNIRDYDSAEVADALFADYDIATRAGAHCAPRMHEALGTVQQGAVRFSFRISTRKTRSIPRLPPCGSWRSNPVFPPKEPYL